MLIPGLFTLLEKVVGPMLTSDARSSILSKVFGGGFGGTASSLMDIITGTLGKLEDEKIVELKGELETLLANCQIDQTEAKSERFLNWGWRPCFAWGLSIIILFHLATAELANVLHMIGYNPGTLAPLDNMTLLIMSGLLGIYMGARTVEKVNTNNSDN